MNSNNNSDTEYLTQADCFSADDFISQSINEGLFIIEKNNIEEQTHFFNPTSLSSSEVEYTLTFDCFLNDFSSDHIGQFKCNANAKYRTSFMCGANSFDWVINWLYCNFSIDSINFSRREKNIINSNSPILEYFFIFSLSFSNSSKAKSGDTNLYPSFEQFFITFLLDDSGLKKENKIFASITKNIYINPCLFATLSFSSSPSFNANLSVISLFFSTLSAYLNSNASVDFSLNAFDTISFNSSLPITFTSISNSLGISTFNSAILYSPYYLNKTIYLNLAELETCTGKYQYCDPSVVDGTGKCSKYPNHMDVWVDYADTGVSINKQPGDKLKLNIFSEQSATVKITYDKNVFDSNDCYTFQIVKPGINTCNLLVKEDIGDVEEEIKVENKPTKVNIITSPDLLIITDSEKLYQEYSQESNAVKAVLKQAYANAEKGNGVVYDLSWYKDEKIGRASCRERV